MVSKAVLAVTLVAFIGLVNLVSSSSPPVSALPVDPQATLNLNYDSAGWRYYPNSPINRCNAHSLRLFKTVVTGPLTTSSSIFSSPLTYGGVVYSSNTEGKIFAHDIATQELLWTINLRLLNWAATPGIVTAPGNPINNAGQYTRTMAISPKYRRLFVGTSVGGFLAAFDLLTGGNTTTFNPAYVGTPIWIKLIHPYSLARSLHGLNIQTDSDGMEWIYMGLTSGEESGVACQGIGGGPVTCGFQSTFNKIDPVTGDIAYSYSPLPPLNGTDPHNQYTGGAIWNTPSFTKKLVCFGTGNTYDVPQYVKDCRDAHGGAAPECDPHTDNWIDSIVCLKRTNLEFVWGAKLIDNPDQQDLYTSICAVDGTPIYPRGAGCQTDFPNLDADFGHAPMFVTIKYTNATTGVTEKVKAGIVANKDGRAFALREKPVFGKSSILWVTKLSPLGLSGGGISFGQTTNGKIACFASINSGPVTFPSDQGGLGTLWNFTRPTVNGLTQTRGGFVSCVDVNTGIPLWEWADPLQARVQGPMSIHGKDGNEVLSFGTFAFNSSPNPPETKNLYYMDLTTGAQLNAFGSIGSRFSNPTCYTLPDGDTLCIVGSGYFAKVFLRAANILEFYKLEHPEVTCPVTCSANNNHHEHGDDDDDDDDDD